MATEAEGRGSLAPCAVAGAGVADAVVIAAGVDVPTASFGVAVLPNFAPAFVAAFAPPFVPAVVLVEVLVAALVVALVVGLAPFGVVDFAPLGASAERLAAPFFVAALTGAGDALSLAVAADFDAREREAAAALEASGVVAGAGALVSLAAERFLAGICRMEESRMMRSSASATTLSGAPFVTPLVTPLLAPLVAPLVAALAGVLAGCGGELGS